VKVDVVSLLDQFTEDDLENWLPLNVRTFPVKGTRSFGFSPDLRRYMFSKSAKFDIIHTHGIWMHPNVVGRQIANKHSIPLIISPRGTLEAWALRHSRWKKRLVRWLFENKNLRSAACLHALSKQEAQSFRSCGLHSPVAVIPNGIELAEYDSLPEYDAITELFPILKNRKHALFLSRIHPKKGLPHLLKAWTALGKTVDEWMLVIAGPGQLGYKGQMKQLAKELGIGQRVLFAEPLYGDDKRKMLASSDIFVLPSFSEGFSMAILEAAACKLPVLLTPPCNFPELAQVGGAIEVEPTEEGTEEGLRHLIALSESKRKEMGSKGRALIESTYTWNHIAKQMADVYRWLLREGSEPSCVRLA
jgi:glycosyltransferase involved in cell wall biosynthesis